MERAERILRALTNPGTLLRFVWKKIPVGSFSLRMKFDVVSRPQYAFGIYHAARLAKALGIKQISCIEFGVADGIGIRFMEEIAREVSLELNIGIQIYGFDLATGLPETRGYKDLPYLWKTGFYRMDYEHLKKQLPTAKLIIGDVRDTVGTFWEKYNPPPIGFVSVDLDLYSSTIEALKIFSTPCETLPRVICYFDDTVDAPDATAMFNDWTGELLAIKEFNGTHQGMKLARINGLCEKRYVRASWPASIYVLHSFEHPRYNDFIAS